MPAVPALPDSLRAFTARVWQDATDPEPGFAVYQRNLHGNFAQVLALEFPALQRLLGEQAFRALARDFQREHPSRSGNLHGIGAPLASFLRRRLAGSPRAWLADVAALEWAWEDAAVAADAGNRVDVAGFATLDPDAQMARRARLHPALRVLRSTAPVHTIWRDNLPDASGRIASMQSDYRLSLDLGGEAVVIERPDQQVEVTVVPDAEAAWLESLANGATQGDAIEHALTIDSRFDLAAALGAALRRHRIIDLQLA
jgi:hypothetical protein